MEELYKSKLQHYREAGIKVIEQWNDRCGSPLQEGANKAIIENKDGDRIEISYMYEDCCWMP